MSKLKYVLLILGVSILIGCGNKTNVITEATDANKYEITEEKEENDKKDENVMDFEKRDFSYNIERVDTSYVTENGERITNIYFEKLVFSNPDDVLKKINEKIENDCEKYLSEEGKEVEEYAIEMYPYYGDSMIRDPYLATNKIIDIFCDEKDISIEMNSYWYAGGVGVLDYICYNFNLDTGEEIKIANFFDSEDDAKQAVVKASLEQIKSLTNLDNGAALTEAEEIINQYKPEDYKFFFDEDKIYVIYDQYEIAIGAEGPIVVEIERPDRILIDSDEKVSADEFSIKESDWEKLINQSYYMSQFDGVVKESKRNGGLDWYSCRWLCFYVYEYESEYPLEEKTISISSDPRGYLDGLNQGMKLKIPAQNLEWISENVLNLDSSNFRKTVLYNPIDYPLPFIFYYENEYYYFYFEETSNDWSLYGDDIITYRNLDNGKIYVEINMKDAWYGTEDQVFYAIVELKKDKNISYWSYDNCSMELIKTE